MKVLRSLLFISFLINFIYSEDDDNDDDSKTEYKEENWDPTAFQKIPGITIRQMRDIETVLDRHDQPILLFHYRESSRASREAVHYLREAAEKLEHIVVTLLIDCDMFENAKDYSKCERNEYTDGFPRISLMYPPPVRFDVFSQTVIKHSEIPWPNMEYTEKNIYNFAIQDYPSRSIKLTQGNINTFLNNDLFAKVILFSDKKAEPLIYKGLSMEFHEKLLFGYVNSKQTDLCKRFGITKFPTLLVVENIENEMVNEDADYTFYKGALKIDEIISFLNKFALREKRYISATRGGIQSLEEKVKIENYKLKELNSTNYVNWFVDLHSHDNVFIYFGKDSPFKNISQYMPYETKKILKSLHGHYHQGYMNCDDEANTKICSQFFVQKSWPNLVYYGPIKDNDLEHRCKSGQSYPTASHNTLRQMLIDKNQGFVSSGDSTTFGGNIKVALTNNKAIIYHLFNDTTTLNLPFYILSNNWNITRRWSFITTYMPDQKMLKYMGLDGYELPILATYFPETSSLEKGILKPLVLNTDMPVSSLKNMLLSYVESIEEISKKSKNLPEFTNSKQFHDKCIKADKELCLIALIDGRKNNVKSIADFEANMKIYSHISAHGSYDPNREYPIYWLNATCHVGSPTLPNLLVLYPRMENYVRHDAPFLEATSLNYFLTNAVKKRFSVYHQFERDNLIFDDDCSLVFEDFEEDKPKEEDKIVTGKSPDLGEKNVKEDHEIHVEKDKEDL